MDLIEEKLKVVIIDDEKHGRDLLKKLISEEDDFFIVGEADGVDSGIDIIQETNPDLVFLDIALSDRTAFDLLEHFDEIRFSVIFATAYNYYAIKAIKFSALDYLVKPIDPAELKQALWKVKSKHCNGNNPIDGRLSLATSMMGKHRPDKIAIPSNSGYNFIDINDIIYCTAENNYTRFHLLNKSSFITCHTLKEYDELLEELDFFRIHNSYLINMHHVQSYIKGKGGFVLMKDGTQIEVSTRKKDLFLKHFTKL